MKNIIAALSILILVSFVSTSRATPLAGYMVPAVNVKLGALIP